MTQKKRIAIIGAGFAGLSAARALRCADAKVMHYKAVHLTSLEEEVS